MTTTIISAKSYSTKSGEIAFQIDYSEGSQVRTHSKIRNAEKIKSGVIEFCKEAAAA